MLGVDLKYIDSLPDTHTNIHALLKGADEFKRKSINSKYIVFIYHPFPTHHISLKSYLKSNDIDEVFFVSKSVTSITHAVEKLNHVLGYKKKTAETINNKIARKKVASKKPTSLESAKRTANEKQGPHAWHPYYAGYSEAFVKSAIKYLKCDQNSIIFEDPWGGSGTTGMVASKANIPSISFDINPAMATFAASKCPEIIRYANNIKSYIDSYERLSINNTVQESDPLRSLYHEDTAILIRSYLDNISFPAALEEERTFGMRFEARRFEIPR